MSYLFIGYNRKLMPVCAKIISFQERKVSHIAKDTCLLVLFRVLWQLLPLWSPSYRLVAYQGFLSQLDTIFQHISQPQISNRIQFAMLGLSA